MRPPAITREVVLQIQAADRAGWKQRDISLRFGVSQAHICRILSGKALWCRDPSAPRYDPKERMRRRWLDPEYRAFHIKRLREQGDRARAASRESRKRIVPAPGTPEFRVYRKLREILGYRAARQELGISL
jgi:hypothetical protein